LRLPLRFSSPKHTPVKHLAILLIVFYQKFISPFKGFRCAYAVLRGGDSCSEAVKKIVRDKGLLGGYRDIRARFQACKEANETLIRNRQRRRGRNDCDECFDCDCTDACRFKKSDACEGMSCDLPDLPCDGPCDCSF
jgi:putative component of membrane protein insertase Oxa1/YidC/SpoIIIJ protein YidD